MDILQKIDEALKNFEINKDFKYIPRDSVIEILEHIKKSVPEDKILLETIEQYVKKDWSVGNLKLIEQFYKVLMFYGIVNGQVQRKSILENKGKTIIKKFVVIENQKQIRKLLT